jgi:hypothetical protein
MATDLGRIHHPSMTIQLRGAETQRQAAGKVQLTDHKREPDRSHPHNSTSRFHVWVQYAFNDYLALRDPVLGRALALATQHS